MDSVKPIAKDAIIEDGVMRMRRYIEFLRNNEKFLSEWDSCFSIYDPFVRAKRQEDLFITYSNGFLWRVCNNSGYAFDNELDLKFGDFRSVDYFFDLKVGLEYTGAISRNSLENFGNTNNNNHFYICVNQAFDSCAIVNAKDLLDVVDEDSYRTSSYNDAQFLGELDYMVLLNEFTF